MPLPSFAPYLWPPIHKRSSRRLQSMDFRYDEKTFKKSEDEAGILIEYIYLVFGTLLSRPRI